MASALGHVDVSDVSTLDNSLSHHVDVSDVSTLHNGLSSTSPTSRPAQQPLAPPRGPGSTMYLYLVETRPGGSRKWARNHMSNVGKGIMNGHLS
ncbi:hypothetical protein PMIN01_10568 [Paraphaeosphaeria minitans]|uniref:Uncharacterized protein n=1 Tax=Paraphaeosphaeria minitans TaxID=565426 RepID=A0A9P6GAD7_9PLEO|nr:hypothetical protein PMIN01_10568 [Paraphaeosphaeria minitans]